MLEGLRFEAEKQKVLERNSCEAGELWNTLTAPRLQALSQGFVRCMRVGCEESPCAAGKWPSEELRSVRETQPGAARGARAGA